MLDENKSFKQPLKIHVKIDSGMGRIGLRDEKALQMLTSVVDSSNEVLLDGIFTTCLCG